MYSFVLQVKKIPSSFSLWILFVSTIISISINADEPVVVSEDRGRLEVFLKHVLIEERGIYTLVGSKPMTGFSIVPVIDDQEKRELYSMQTDQFRKYISFEKYRPSKEDARKLWYDWKKIEHKYLGNQFLIREEKKLGAGLLINVLSTTYVLKKHYSEFVRTIGEPFDPEKFVYRIGDDSDPFWEKIRQNHFLLGVLFGFGEKNSRFFTWENAKNELFPQRRSSCFSPVGSGLPVHELTIEDLDLPAFISYQIIDEQVEQYRLERERSIEFFKGKDFCELAASILKGAPPQPPKKELSAEATRLVREKLGYNSR
jgi:hypothetical protein